jgi:menaquinone-specific isochorismate synthase
MDPQTARDASWRDLGSGVFWAPLLEWGRRGTEGYLAVNLSAGPLPKGQFEELDLILSRLGGLQQRLPEVPQGRVVGHQPSEEEWLVRVEEVLGEISRGTYRKIVLARKTAVDMDAGADPASYLATRMHSGLDVFLLRRGGSVFWGLSPERLISRNRDQVWSEALAGTRPRGATIADDQKLERELMGSDKDRREQDLVREFIEGTMGPWCRKVQTGITQVRKFRSIQHLYTPFQGDLKNPDAFAELAGALHPTPAVAIFQQGRRLDIIRDLEGFDRGWYGGVAGWISKDQGELAVGIRSCLSRGASWTFWTGAGIVEGSSGHREWHELEQKLSAYGDLLS